MTNWHVLDGVASAEIITNDGKTYKVLGVYNYDVENDLARIQIGGSGFTPISVDYSGSLLTGATVYAIGNPQDWKTACPPDLSPPPIAPSTA